MSTQSQHSLTSEQYLAFERASEQKHEYYAGRVYAMASASENHNLIVANIIRELGNQLRKRDCTVYPSDMRVKIEEAEAYTYPDIIVVCGKEHFDDIRRDTLLNPTLLIEVLSPSTAKHDRGKKFKCYRALPSFVEYVLVSQDYQHIERFMREAIKDKWWNWSDANDVGEAVTLASINCTLSIADVYEKVSFDVPEVQGEQQ